MSVECKIEQLRTEVLGYIHDAEAVITRLKNECEDLQTRLAHSESERARLVRIIAERDRQRVEENTKGI